MPQLDESEFSDICKKLQADNKCERKQALQTILQDVLVLLENLDERNSLELWETFHRPVVRILHDPVEACRDLALEILKKFLLHLPCSDKNIVYVIPIMSKRLGCQELIEQSEEVRLKSIILLRSIVIKYNGKMASYIEDLIAILTRTVMDKYPRVKQESCECICALAKGLKNEFYSRSEAFVKPILTNMSHQHYKIRVMTVETIGTVLLNGNGKSIEFVTGPLAERLFDQSGAVRTAVVEVAGKFLTDLKDRYSWWHRLVPLLLTGMSDVLTEVREKSAKLWMAVGEKYIQENESDKRFKEKLDFLPEDLPHYPPNVVRPNLGCRTICQQNFCKLSPAISRELNDWLPDIKLRAAQLLCILVLNVEEEIIQYIPKLLPSMYRACNDEDSRVIENVELAAEYMGYFVSPKLSCDIILPTMDGHPTSGHLKILAAVLRGSPRCELKDDLPRVGKYLEKDEICQSNKFRYQMEVLNCCQSLLEICGEDCSAISKELFKSIFTTLALAEENFVKEKAVKLLECLKEVEKLENMDDLFHSNIRNILVDVQNEPESWTASSCELKIFQASITHAKVATYDILDLISPIFVKTINADCEKKMKLRQYFSLSEYFQQWDQTLEGANAEAFIKFSNAILEQVIVPGLQWTAGRSAEAIRTASIGCLCALLNKIVDNCEQDGSDLQKQKKFVISIEHFGWLFEKVRPILVTLFEDDAYKTRLYSLQAICLVINIGQELSYINEDHIHKTSCEIVPRLEDPHDEVRLAAIEALKEIWKVLPENYDLNFYYVHIDYVYEKTLVHLDDPAEKFQKQVLECMIGLVKIHPELLIEKIMGIRSNFINQKTLDQLENLATEELKRRKV
ncbi:hypothetical protein QAD02_017388 [Eretmocerus hayati]|uniref:Uncharacterized protein n=1 Tax=Eretmocerus hayati TaxID=131215 RepID=A0ACC2PFJ9_9HYME|nr:hypothetical protein QAD02_017388 [Eretmocerus hayati]